MYQLTGAGLSGDYVDWCQVSGSLGLSSLCSCRQTPVADYWHCYNWPPWFLLCWHSYMELCAISYDRHVNGTVQFQKTAEDIVVLFHWTLLYLSSCIIEAHLWSFLQLICTFNFCLIIKIIIRPKKIIVVSGNPTDPSFYPPTLKILWSFYILRPKFAEIWTGL